MTFLSDHGQGVISAVAAQREGGKRGEATQRDEATLTNLKDYLSKEPSPFGIYRYKR